MSPGSLAALPRVLVRLGYRRPVTVLLGGLLVIAAGILLGTRLRFETDVLNLLPRHDPVVTRFRQVLDEFGTLDTVLLAVPVAGEDSLDRSLALVDRVGEELGRCEYLVSVESRLQDPALLADTVLRHAVLFLDADGLRALEGRLGDEGLRARAADIRAALDAPLGMVAKEFAVRDPLGFLPLLLARLNRAPAALKVDFSSGYYLSGDHSMVLIIAKPIKPAQDIDFDHTLFADLDARIGRARAAVASDEDIDVTEVPEVLLGGGHRIALEDASLIKRDIMANSLSSLIGVSVLFFLAYRRFATVHFAFLPLATGLATTFVFAAVALGSLNSATSGFAAMLVGLGIDFTIVTYGRYLEARQRGVELTGALDEMAAATGPAVMIGALTTVGTFFAFFATRFSGLREFGLLTGTGIIFMMLAAFLVLPAMIAIFDRNKVPRAMSRWLELEGVIRFSLGHRRALLAFSVVFTVASLGALRFVKFDDDVRNMRSPSNQGVAVQEKVARAFGLSFNAMMIRVEGANEAAVLETVQGMEGGLDRLRLVGEISGHESIANLVPPRAAQEQALEWLRTRGELTDPERVARAARAALAAQGLVPAAFERGFVDLAGALRPAGPVALSMWSDTPVEQVVERSVRATDGRVVTVINVFAPPGQWRREAPPGLQALVDATPGAALTGINLVSQRLRRVVWTDAVVAGVLGFIAVLALLLIDLRSLRAAGLCLLPVALGVLWTLGVMAALGRPLNLLNVFVITMIIGVGSDYAIHMLHRRSEGADFAGLGQTARAVVLSALTTIVGFGSLVMTSYPGLQSMGWMASIGVFFSCLVAVTVVPLLAGSRGAEGAVPVAPSGPGHAGGSSI